MVRTSNADFVSNFDLVTEQDLLNVHSSTKFVISSAKSELISNVVKSLKAKKEKDMEQQNDTNRRNLLKVHVDKEDVSQTIVDNITDVNEIELEVQQDHADKI